MTNVAQPSAPAVVLVEDDPNDAFFVRRAFEKAQIANPFVAFATAEQARRDIAAAGPTARPALFVLDIYLAGGESGLEFLRWLRQQPAPLGSTQAIMLTGSVSPVDQNEAEMLGSIYFLNKPVTEERLIAAVQSLGCLLTNLPGVPTQRAIVRQM